jgi:hypothetical protein
MKTNIEEAIRLAAKNLNAAEKRAEDNVEAHDEVMYWSGVQEALQWVLSKDNDFVSYQ